MLIKDRYSRCRGPSQQCAFINHVNPYGSRSGVFWSPGPRGRWGQPVQEADFFSAVGPSGVECGPAGPRGGPCQGSGSAAALLQHPAALQRCSFPAGAHRRSGCSAAHPPLSPQTSEASLCLTRDH